MTRMPRYRIFYLRDTQVEKFRGTPPREKPYHLRTKDYDEGGVIEAESPYAVWKQLQENEAASQTKRPLGVGDALEGDESPLLLLNYWGFDEALWRTPEESLAEEELQALAPSAGIESLTDEVTEPGT